MNKYLISGSLVALALIISGGVAYAQTGPGGGEDQGPRSGGGFRGEGGPGGGMRAPGNFGSSTMMRGPGFRNGSTTDGRGEFRDGTSTDARGPMMRGIPGTVSEVDADHFLMTSHLKDATTTLTVNVSAATSFVHGSSTSASLADLSVGTKVVVIGKVATSTNTVTADRVVFGVQGMGRGDERGRAVGDAQRNGSTQSSGSFFDNLKKFFGFRGGNSDQQPTQSEQIQQAPQNGDNGGPASAASSGGFVNSVMQSLFGWFHEDYSKAKTARL